MYIFPKGGTFLHFVWNTILTIYQTISHVISHVIRLTQTIYFNMTHRIG